MSTCGDEQISYQLRKLLKICIPTFIRSVNSSAGCMNFCLYAEWADRCWCSCSTEVDPSFYSLFIRSTRFHRFYFMVDSKCLLVKCYFNWLLKYFIITIYSCWVLFMWLLTATFVSTSLFLFLISRDRQHTASSFRGHADTECQAVVANFPFSEKNIIQETQNH